jgi:hypothetical protein
MGDRQRTRTQQVEEGTNYISKSPAYVLPLALVVQIGIAFFFPFLIIAVFVPPGYRVVLLPYLVLMLAIEEFYPGKLFMWSLFFAALVTPNRKAPT